MSAELLFCSHRGLYTHQRLDGRLVARRGGGGLIGAIAPVLERFGGTWVAAATSEGDRELARAEPRGRETDGFVLRLLDLPPEDHRLHYDVVSNEYLWFAFHYLFDVPSQPVFGAAFGEAWDAYERVNRLYAEAVLDAHRPDAVLVEDYHLIRVGAEVRRLGWTADVPLLYFHHTPWCDPDYFSLFPDRLRRRILEGLLAYDAVGFHADRWARAFCACCERFCGADVSEGAIRHGDRTTQVTVSSVPLDVDRLRERAASERTERWLERIEAERRGRRLLTRVDRIDLSKNPLRGFLAFEELCDRRPEIARDVWFLALQYPSRLGVARYRKYFLECMRVVRRINERFADATPGGEGPIGWRFEDDFDQSLAAMRACDAVLVNPVFDGLNLVSKEMPTVNEHDAVLLLSRNAGVFEEIGDAALGLDPFDVTGTAGAIEESMDMPAPERHDRAERLRRLATTTTPEHWARERLGAVDLSL